MSQRGIYYLKVAGSEKKSSKRPLLWKAKFGKVFLHLFHCLSQLNFDQVQSTGAIYVLPFIAAKRKHVIVQVAIWLLYTTKYF